MTNPKSRYDWMVSELKAHGHRLTPQRLALLKLLSSATDHPSASQLHERISAQFPTTSLATVYKTLSILTELGLVEEMGFSHDDNRYDGSHSEAHAHVICVRCRKIIDADLPSLASLQESVVEKLGYCITGQRVEFYGLCPECQSKSQS